jgi:hypothetical protein
LSLVSKSKTTTTITFKRTMIQEEESNFSYSSIRQSRRVVKFITSITSITRLALETNIARDKHSKKRTNVQIARPYSRLTSAITLPASVMWCTNPGLILLTLPPGTDEVIRSFENPEERDGEVSPSLHCAWDPDRAFVVLLELRAPAVASMAGDVSKALGERIGS